ncbi:alpha/beta hydrolase [Rhodobacteraceae bacterium CCMM004]|nr:alpha/beta hydrolase [Rhodobacteraceae bacterium CCMM004]
MRRLGRAAAGLIAVVVAAVAVLWLAAPPERAVVPPPFDAARLGGDLDSYFAAAEREVPDLRPGAEKRVVWPGAPGRSADLALVYLHGYSATARDIHPVAERVAARLNAPLILTRLAGHGRDGAALAEPRAGDWLADLDEALSAGRSVADRVLVMGSSTGGTLAAIAGADPRYAEGVAGVVLLSPNFAMSSPAARLLRWPGVRLWGPWVAGEERSFAPLNAEHAAWWTPRYPTSALVALGALVAHAADLDYAATEVPALFVWSDADRVVRPEATRAVAERWGGSVTVRTLDPGPGDDPNAHVLAGDILSPGLTDAMTEIVAAWAEAL